MTNAWSNLHGDGIRGGGRLPQLRDLSLCEWYPRTGDLDLRRGEGLRRRLTSFLVSSSEELDESAESTINKTKNSIMKYSSNLNFT